MTILICGAAHQEFILKVMKQTNNLSFYVTKDKRLTDVCFSS